MHASFISAHLQKPSRVSHVSWHNIVCPCCWSSTAPSTLQSSLAPNCSGLALQFWCCCHCQLPSFGKHVFSMPLLCLVLGVVGVGGSSSLLFAGPSFSSTKEILVGWGPLAGLPWRPPPHARALRGCTNFVGTNAQAHLLVMSLNVAKCNLSKVNLKAMLVSSFPSNTRGGPMLLAGAPCGLYAVLPRSSSQSVIAIACCLRASLCIGFPSLPPS